MRKAKFSQTQIVAILKDAESGVPAADLLRKHGVSSYLVFGSRLITIDRTRRQRSSASRYGGGMRKAPGIPVSSVASFAPCAAASFNRWASVVRDAAEHQSGN